MKQASKTLWALPLSFLLLLLLTTFVLAQETEDEKEFDYFPWSPKGPENWGSIKPEWATCSTGQMQSPINLIQPTLEPAPESEVIFQDYNPENAILKNRGHDVAVEWQNGGGKIQINGTDYILRQCHWHSPSEHAINGKRYDVELHLVHMSANGEIAVIGILYQCGDRPNPFLEKLRGKLKVLAVTSKNEVEAGIVDPREANPCGNFYYRYMGSLTTPPCTEGVLWTVNRNVETVTMAQIRLLKAAVHEGFQENARPLQPLNGRDVRLYYQLPLGATPSEGLSSM